VIHVLDSVAAAPPNMDLFKGIGFFALNLNEEQYPLASLPQRLAHQQCCIVSGSRTLRLQKRATQKNAVQ